MFCILKVITKINDDRADIDLPEPRKFKCFSRLKTKLPRNNVFRPFFKIRGRIKTTKHFPETTFSDFSTASKTNLPTAAKKTLAIKNFLLYNHLTNARAFSSVGRAPPLQGGCREFEPLNAHSLKKRAVKALFCCNKRICKVRTRNFRLTFNIKFFAMPAGFANCFVMSSFSRCRRVFDE